MGAMEQITTEDGARAETLAAAIAALAAALPAPKPKKGR